MVVENYVKVAGLLHFIKGHMEDQNQLGKYVHFSVRQDTQCSDGRVRHDFLVMRAYDGDIKEWIKDQQEGAPVRVEGEVKSSLGSGEMYILVKKIESL
ncbi:MAG: DNA-binding protein [Synergistales bacterium]|nr:DNA-binding protein [Synergistales bacterium]